MAKLPEKIIVLTFNPNYRHKIVLNILKEFFETFPHILTTLNDGVDYYIFPNSEIIKDTLNTIYNTLDINLYIDAFRCEKYIYDTVNPRIWDTYTIKPNSWCYDVLPDCVPIFEPNDVKKLQYFLED